MPSLKFGKLFGIGLELHWSFLLVAALVVFSLALFQPGNLLPVIMFFSLLFMSVFLHELTHSVVSLQRGIRVKKIMLLPIGGVALTEEMPEKPKDEFLIAVSGPLFNFSVAALLFLFVSAFPLPFPSASAAELIESFFSGSLLFEESLLSYPLFALLWINIVLGAFNLLLPALPLDGGRVFRSLLSVKFGYVRATSIIARTSTFVAILLFLSVFTLGILAPIVGIIILFGSREEERIVKMKHFFRNARISEILDRKPVLIEARLPLRDAVEEMLRAKKTALLVELEKGYGVLSARQIIEAGKNLDSPAGETAAKVKPVSLEAKASVLVERVLSQRAELIPVMHKGELAGAISLPELESFFQLKRLERML